MTERIINKNFALSASFNRYVIAHPDTTLNLPKNSFVIFADSSDAQLSRINRKLAHDIPKSSGRIFCATKKGTIWKLEPVSK